ncbi:uncharacterized protein LOC135211682 [Macrobrachium nipponense]|uniref:uncharacterized protein LOC135211682 n=1 Tax=Macrobrachium nipponense TaxID=159736 RepID=UPI0030C8B819
MQLDVAVDLLTKAKTFPTNYRRTGFASAQASAKEAVLKRLRTTNKHFAYEAPHEPIADAMKRLEATFLNVVVDTVTESLTDRFETLGLMRDRFGVLLNFQKLDDQALSNQCDNLCMTLGTGNESDIDGKELAVAVKNLSSLPSDDMTALKLLTFLHKKHLEELYPNLWVALRIACTLPVTVAASAERSFSKLKLIKTNLKSSMGQDRLTGLAIININHEVGKQVSFEDIIDDFVSKKKP